MTDTTATNPDYTALLLIIDRSGSMVTIRDDMVGGVTSLLANQAALPGTLTVDIVTFDTESGYLGDVFYDLAKATTNRLAFACAQELAPHGVTALGLSPGVVRTERAVDVGHADRATESPLYAGRALAALAADPGIATRAGRILHAGDLAAEYGFTDADGSRPARFRVEPGDNPPPEET